MDVGAAKKEQAYMAPAFHAFADIAVENQIEKNATPDHPE